MTRRWSGLLFLLGCTAAPFPSPPGAPRTLADDGQEWRVNRDELAAFVRAPAPGPRVFNFWATWCGPCRAEMPMLRQFAKDHPSAQLWLVNTDHPSGPSEKVDRWVQELEIGGMLHLRPATGEGEVTAALPGFPDVLPVTLVADQAGAPSRTWLGVVDRAELAAEIDRLR